MSMWIPLVLGQAIVGGYGQTSPASAELDGYYNPRKEVTFSGTVTGKTKGKVPGQAQGMSILVKSGKTLREVEMGPAWYVGRQSASVNMGDKVKITGVPLKVGRENVILARQITRGKNILALRDRDGMPYWNPVRRSTKVAVNGWNNASQRMDTRYEGTIRSANTFLVDGENYSGYVLSTPNGPVNVAVAPSWYWNNQPTYFRVGDNVTLFGNGGATNVGGVILVNSLNYNGGSIVLRPGGFPVFGGFRRF